jgi:hypothetical protein
MVIRFLQFMTMSFQTFYTAHRNKFCRAAVVHFFMLEGLLAGVFASQLPTIQDNAELSDSALGTCVLFLYFGTVLATPLAGKLIGYATSPLFHEPYITFTNVNAVCCLTTVPALLILPTNLCMMQSARKQVGDDKQCLALHLRSAIHRNEPS